MFVVGLACGCLVFALCVPCVVDVVVVLGWCCVFAFVVCLLLVCCCLFVWCLCVVVCVGRC